MFTDNCQRIRFFFRLTIAILALIHWAILDAPSAAMAQEDATPRRVALVIGNSEYKVGKLANPKNDARDVSEALRQVGFEVTTKLDRTKFELEQDIDELTDNLAKGDALLFFYAGHGVQLKNSNYLVPIDAKIEREHHVRQRCVDADYLLSAIEGSGASLRIVVLDACRHNPFRGFSRGIRVGLAAVAAPDGTIVAFSTAPGRVASDGDGDNSPFTKHLVKVLKSNPKDGLEVSQLFNRVARAVKKETGQRAYLTTDASMDRYFLKPAVTTGSPAPDAPAPRAAAIVPLESYVDEDIDLVRRHASAGIPEAQNYLGDIYKNGHGVNRDYAQAVAWYRKATQQNHAPAQNGLGTMYEFGYGVSRDNAQAVAWYRKAADQEYPMAQRNLGAMYDRGLGVSVDLDRALDLFRKAAQQKNASAQNYLGYMYKNGRGVPRDSKQAATWYRKAAEQNYTRAQHTLGAMYDKGDGLPRDYNQAVVWFRKAADRNYAAAQNYLGYMYQTGRGVERDYGQAVAWYRKSAEQNYADSQLKLGHLYYDGRGVARDFEQAAAWYGKAAEQNHRIAQHKLGNMYEFGQGVTQNKSEAIRLYRLALAQGYQQADISLKRLRVQQVGPQAGL